MLKVVLIALLLVLLLLAALGISLFRIATVRKGIRITGSSYKRQRHLNVHSRLIEAGKQWLFDQNPERIEIQSYDGLKLVGFYVPCEDARCTILLMHGFRSDGYTDFSCALEFYHRLGCNLLVVHQRAHGESEGRYITFGVRERYDCLSWLGYLNGRFGTETDIFLDGISMGSSTVLMASGLELPENVRGIISDCGFTTPWDEYAHILKRGGLPARPVLDIFDIFTRRIAGFGLKEASTVEALKKCRIPVLFVHGEEDNFVPARFSRENYEACTSEKKLIIVPGAAHGVSYLIDTPGCQQALTEFIDKHCTK